ncbi:hypothetical protein ACHAXT_010998 [Thalassiosira profunda]
MPPAAPAQRRDHQTMTPKPDASASGAATPAFASPTAGADPHLWLEDVLGTKALDWVESCNARCLASVGDPTRTPAYDRIKAILDSKDKIPHAYRIGNENYYNFWQDADHVQGIWRRTTLDSFKGEEPKWTTVLDLDALPPPTTDTAKTWVWHGSTLLDEGPASQWDRALIRLSPGGSDADTCREFDMVAEKFVEPEDGGFALPEPAKTRLSYRSRNEVLVGTDFGEGSLTDSGYPRVVKSWKRGTPLEEAVTVFEGKQTDIAAHQYAYHDRGCVHEFQLRSITFYTSEYHYRKLTADGIAGTTADAEATPFVKVPIPLDAELESFADMALITLRSDFVTPAGTTFKAGALVTLPMSELMANDWNNASAMFSPTASRSLSSTSECKDYTILKILEDVKTVLEFWKYDAESKTWKKQQPAGGEEGSGIPIGQDVSIGSHCRDSASDNQLYLFRDGYLVPDTLEMASAEDCCASTERIKSKPAMFNADGLIVEQKFATSKDGTRIPYFVMRRADLEMNGDNPVLLDAYGGFEISLLPGYSAGVGAGWLERGGCKVIANIRGGGEYGPAWHQAALKEKRYKCFEDMEAVAQALIDSKLTSRERLACIGGSNGGLLVGNLITRPVASRLFGAAVCQVPLLDMKRYSNLLAGASWMGEYGNPETEEWKFLRKHSPYHLLRNDILGAPELLDDDTLGEHTESTDPGWKCPKVLFTTSTRDDRVHPGHARKMVAALLGEAGKDKAPVVEYWENTEGGHGGAADNSQRAHIEETRTDAATPSNLHDRRASILAGKDTSHLFGAAVCQVPLLDMKRYSNLLAGASWMGEYGNPETNEWKFLRKHSPYHLLRNDILGKPELLDDNTLGEPTDSTDPGWKCPKVLFTTSTRDDRVHPGHARKMVASLLDEAGKDKAPVVEYWENTEGGHGGAADNSQRAHMWALTYNFLVKTIGEGKME